MDELLWLRFVSGLGLGLHHSKRHRARRRVQPEEEPRCAHDVHYRRIHARRGDRRLRRAAADSGVRLAVRVLLRRRRAARDRACDALGAAGVAAVSRRAQDSASTSSRAWLRQLDPKLRVDASTQFVANESSRAGVPIFHLFRDGRALFTILLWIVNFTNILVLYSLSNWSPTIFTSMGYTEQTSLFVGTLLQVGGTIGTFASRLGDRSPRLHVDARRHVRDRDAEHRVHRSSRAHDLARCR